MRWVNDSLDQRQFDGALQRFLIVIAFELMREHEMIGMAAPCTIAMLLQPFIELLKGYEMTVPTDLRAGGELYAEVSLAGFLTRLADQEEDVAFGHLGGSA